MNIKKSSWHYRLANTYNKWQKWHSIPSQISFCDYSGHVISGFGAVCALILIGAFIFAAPMVYVAILSSGYPNAFSETIQLIKSLDMDINPVLIGITLISLVVDMIITAVICAIIAFGICSILWQVIVYTLMSGYFYIKYKKKYDPNKNEYDDEEEEKEPSFIMTWLKAKHAKFCPLVKIVD